MTSLSLGVGLHVSLSGLCALLFQSDEKSVSLFKAHLMEVGLGYYKSDFVAVVDHLNFQDTAHRIASAIQGYKNCGVELLKKCRGLSVELSLKASILKGGKLVASATIVT